MVRYYAELFKIVQRNVQFLISWKRKWKKDHFLLGCSKIFREISFVETQSYSLKRVQN